MMTKKRQDLPAHPGLWIVATPIGNLGDLSPRARDALARADAVLCEDTRRTRELLAALALTARLERLDAHASESRLSEIVERLTRGETFAYVADAGTPAISDPGAPLVAKAREAGVEVTPIPGPSAAVALLSVSGFGETAFTFRGFFPRKESEAQEELKEAISSRTARVFVWYESPHRIVEALDSISRAQALARVVAAKELTKLHERVFTGTAEEAARAVRDEITREGEIGEWCFAVLFHRDSSGPAYDESWEIALKCLISAQISPSDAAKRVSQYFGIGKNAAYNRALELSGKKSSKGD